MGARAGGAGWAGPGSGGESGGSGWCPSSARKRFVVGIIFLAGLTSLPTSRWRTSACREDSRASCDPSSGSGSTCPPSSDDRYRLI